MTQPTFEQLKAADEKSRVDESIVLGALARVPPSWEMIERLEGGGGFRRGGIQVLFTVAREDDGNIWVHASAAGRRGPNNWFLPAWEDMKRVKADFIGPDKWAYQVFPSEKDYINHNPYVLHLFALLDGKPALPDFTKGLGTI